MRLERLLSIPKDGARRDTLKNNGDHEISRRETAALGRFDTGWVDSCIGCGRSAESTQHQQRSHTARIVGPVLHRLP